MSTTEDLNENLGPRIIATICSLVCLSTIFVAMRLYVRIRMIRARAIDDYVVVASLFFSWLTVAIEIWAVQEGNGRHAAALTPAQQQAAALSNISGFTPNVLAYTVPKFAVAALLTRLLVPGRLSRIVLWTLPCVCLTLVIVCVVVLFAQCTPARAQWDFSITDKKCWSPWVLVDIAIVTGIWSAITDMYLAVYPATVLLKLQMRIQKKIALAVALGIGSISSIIAVYKTTRLPSLASSDFSYATADLVIWTVIEGNTLIIAACIPALGPLADLVLHSKAFGSSGRKYPYYPNHYYHRGVDGNSHTGHTSRYSYAAGAAVGSTRLKDLPNGSSNNNNNNNFITTTDKSSTYPASRLGGGGGFDGGAKDSLDVYRSGGGALSPVGAGATTSTIVGPARDRNESGGGVASSLAGSEDSILGPDDKPDGGSGSGSGSGRGSGIMYSRSVSVSYAAAQHAM